MKKHLAVFATMLTLLACCKKDVNPTYYLSQETKDFCVFRKNSKWVYKNQNNEKDTLQIYSTEGKISKSRSFGYDTEIYLYKAKSSFYLDTLQSQLSNLKDDILFSVNIVGYYSMPMKSKYLYLGDVLLNHSWQNDWIIYKAYYPNYSVKDKIYTDVREFLSNKGSENGNANVDPRLPNRVWYARHAGIIKKQLPNGEVWELIHHEVTQ